VDFGHYARTTVRRRLTDVAVRLGSDLAGLRALVARERRVLDEVIAALCVQVTSMFRDSEFFRAYRARAAPLLRDRMPVRAWHAGCASGEEVWSHAVVLIEEGAGGHLRLYGTDVDEVALARARRGALPIDRMREYTLAYQRAGGREELSGYYRAGPGGAAVRDALRERVFFGRHDLAADAPPGTFDAVFCRNVLIYFDPVLQSRAHALLTDGVRPGGILALGKGETLPRALRDRWEALDERNGIFLRRATPSPSPPASRGERAG
jgi:chemotaxis protein methyltransferase CheR